MSTATAPVGPPDSEMLPRPRAIRAVQGAGDRVFFGFTLVGGLIVLAITLSIGVFLSIKASQALGQAKFRFLTTQQWQPDVHRFGIAAVLVGTVLIAIVGLSVSTPVALGTALFISEIAPRWLKQWLVFGIDLMAAVPSVIYGLWGFYFLEKHMVGVGRFIATWFAWIPFLKVPGAHPNNPLDSNTIYSASTLIVGLVVAMMMIPIQCSIMREAFSQAPPGEREGAYALGATRWGMITSVVLPFARGGIIGGTMLGLGRALGETIAVLLIISPVYRINWHIVQNGGDSVAALIAGYFSEASGFGLSALMAAGLALFVMTLVINFAASAVIARSRSGAISE